MLFQGIVQFRPRAETNAVAVDRDTGGALKRGASVCIPLSPCRLGILWYDAAVCG
jgi:hypothetical protein